MNKSRAVESPEQLKKTSQELVMRATQYLQKEVKKNPYTVLGAAASLGYMLGQGWVRGFLRLGLAFVAQEAARRSLGDFDLGHSNKTVH